MAVYDLDGNVLNGVYDESGSELIAAYDVDGNQIYAKYDPPSDDPYLEGRTIVFEDNFNYFNSSMWVHEIGNVRNYNRELQCYRSENVSIEDSCLVLTAKRESYGGKEWTSGSISGQTLQNLTYGRFDAKVKCPNVVGAWCGFWMVGSNFWKEYIDGDRPINHGTIWPACGEIDVQETMPGNATNSQANLWSYTGGSLGTGASSGVINVGDWHVYGLEWTDTYIAALLDGVEFKRWTFSSWDASVTQAYHLPFYMILNLAIGGAGGQPLDTTEEMKMYVDWVRVYAPLES